MGSLVSTLISLAAAGTMMLSAPLDQAAPQHDAEGTLFLVNRQWRVHQYYVPEHMRQAEVTGQIRTMREEAAAALEAMLANPAAREKAAGEMAEAEEMLGDFVVYPSLFVKDGEALHAVARGYAPYDTVAGLIDKVLSDAGASAQVSGQACGLDGSGCC